MHNRPHLFLFLFFLRLNFETSLVPGWIDAFWWTSEYSIFVRPEHLNVCRSRVPVNCQDGTKRGAARAASSCMIQGGGGAENSGPESADSDCTPCTPWETLESVRVATAHGSWLQPLRGTLPSPSIFIVSSCFSLDASRK